MKTMNKILFLKITKGELVESQLMDDFIGDEFKDFKKLEMLGESFKIAKDIPVFVQTFVSVGDNLIRYKHNPSQTYYEIRILNLN